MISKLLPFAITAATATAVQLCPPLGPVLPPATDLSKSAALKAAFANITASLSASFASGESPYDPVTNDTSFGFQIFSSQEKLWEHYIEGSGMNREVGVEKIDGETVWRIGSVSKLVTVYLFLAEVGDGHWDDPITQYVPELKNWPGATGELSRPKWEEITLGALAGQISGISRDAIALDAFMQPIPAWDDIRPPLNKSEKPACSINTPVPCSREQFFEALNANHPVYKPNNRPMYSNTNYVLLTFALEAITGKSYRDIFESRLVEELGLRKTFYTEPDAKLGVIHGGINESGWNVDMGISSPMGGFYLSINDLSSVARTILSSTLLPQNATRAWLKPTAHTTNPLVAVGRPWEIYRYPIGPAEHNRVVDVYTKSGESVRYHTFLVLIPEYDVGWTVISTGDTVTNWADDVIAAVLIPALEEAAREQAEARYAGTYTTSHNSTNTSITITTTPGRPGLGVKSWTHNSTDMISFINEVMMPDSSPPLSEASLRVYPTDLEEETDDGYKKTQWRLMPMKQRKARPQLLIPGCVSWADAGYTGLENGVFDLDEMIFSEKDEGDVRIDWPALKTEVVKQT